MAAVIAAVACLLAGVFIETASASPTSPNLPVTVSNHMPLASGSMSGPKAQLGTIYYTKDRYHANAGQTLSYENKGGSWYRNDNGKADPTGGCGGYINLSLRTYPSLTSFTNSITIYNVAKHAGPLAWHPQNVSPRYFRVTRYANGGSCGSYGYNAVSFNGTIRY